MRWIFLVLGFMSSSAYGCLNGFDSSLMDRIMNSRNGLDKQFMVDINRSVLLIKGSKYQVAIQLLLNIEERYPDQYETATNLGTVFELTSEIDKAIFWIKRGIELNPRSHDGTEWLHYKILVAKSKFRKDKDWLKRNPVFELGDHDRFEAIKATQYQLSERIKFVSAPDDIVSDLYFLQGLLYQVDGNPILMRSAFSKSLEYGDLRRSKIEKN